MDNLKFREKIIPISLPEKEIIKPLTLTFNMKSFDSLGMRVYSLTRTLLELTE